MSNARGRWAQPWFPWPCGGNFPAMCEFPPSHFICSPPPSPPPTPPPSPPPAPPPRQLKWLNPRNNVTYLLDTNPRTFAAATAACTAAGTANGTESFLTAYWTAQDQVGCCWRHGASAAIKGCRGATSA
jgi:hypothetical protein